MSDYHLVSSLHAAKVALADARKVGDAAAVLAADSEIAAATAAVDAALADGRVASAAHLLDLDLDCLGVILSHLSPEDALQTSHTCTTLRSALYRGGLPGPLASACRKEWTLEDTATKEAALRALDGMAPALGAKRLEFWFHLFDEGHARMLARALDAAPRATWIDITLCYPELADVGRLADVLSSPDRVFAAPPQVHLFCEGHEDGEVQRLANAGVCVASIVHFEPMGFEDADFVERVAAHSANTLTQLQFRAAGTVDLTTRFPALRRLILEALEDITTDVPSLMALAPQLKEIQFKAIFRNRDGGRFDEDVVRPPKQGFGLQPLPFAQFMAAIQGVTCVCFGPELDATLSQNENENLGQLTALRTLCDLDILQLDVWIALGPRSSRPGSPRAPVAEDAVTNMPSLPTLTRLTLSLAARMSFGHPLPALRVLDCRGAWATVPCTSFYREGGRPVGTGDRVERRLRVPLAIPSAAIAPNLHTLLIGYGKRPYPFWKSPPVDDGTGDFDLWTLVAARTALRVVVIEKARLFCNPPQHMTTTAFDTLLARESRNLVSIHTHGCEIEGGHEPAVENFLRALEGRGGRVCRAGVEECLFCVLHDGADLWPRQR